MKKEKVISATKKTRSKIIEMTRKSNEAILGVVDINGDGKFDKNDVDVILQTRKMENDRKKLRPVFKEQVTTNHSIINIVGEDKKRSESSICDGAVGYLTKLQQDDMLNIYETNVDVLDAQFYPHVSKGIYLLNPYQNGLYIQQEEYFNYLKKAFVNELEHVAQHLGAQYFMVSFSEKVNLFEEKKNKLKFGIQKVARINASNEHSSEFSETSSTKIAVELEFEGNGIPTRPELIYFRNESDMEKLIFMRTNPKTENMIKSKKYVFNCNSLSGITESQAAEIEVALVKHGVVASKKFSESKKKENNTILEYTIRF